MLKAKISEVFSSLQGEGIYQGEKQMFVRFFGCNLNCGFCDTEKYKFKEYSAEELFRKMEYLDKDSLVISFTGGEPLMQIDFLSEVIPLCRQHKKKIYLETNGTLSEALEKIIDLVDIVAMDFKLPSSTGGRAFWEEHQRFLRVSSKKEVFVKAVICKSTKEEDIIKSVEILKEFATDIPFVLQPNSFEKSDALTMKMLEYKKYCQRYLFDVRILPRYHEIFVSR